MKPRPRVRPRNLREWLDKNTEDHKGAKGAVRLSNRTDNESAKMAGHRQRRCSRLYRGAVDGDTGHRRCPSPWHRIGTGAVAAGGRNHRRATHGHDRDHRRFGLSLRSQSQGACRPTDHNRYRKRDERYANQDIHKTKQDLFSP